MPRAVPVIIDTDPGIDDAVAIALALASPELDVRALTTVCGNVAVDRTTRNALDILALAGRTDIPVGAGADRPFVATTAVDASAIHGYNGLGGTELPRATSDADPRGALPLMVDVIESSTDPVTVLAIGPLTNLAALHAAHPTTFAKIGRIVMMGGGTYLLGNDAIAAEFNVWFDPEAAARVFAAGAPITMVGLDVTERPRVRPSDLEPLRTATPFLRTIATLIDHFLDHDTARLGERCTTLHDALAVAHVIDGSLLELQPYWVGIECTGTLTRGMTVVDVRHFTKRPPNALVALGVDEQGFVDLLVDRLTGR